MHALLDTFVETYWSKIYQQVSGAIVFLDEASIECLHWDGGVANLLAEGATLVKLLTPFESCHPTCKKAVFITQLTSLQLNSIKEIIRHSDITHSTIISTTSLDVVFFDLNEGSDVSEVVSSGKAPIVTENLINAMVKAWIGKEKSESSVMHLPISIVPITDSIFVTPPLAEVYPTFDGSLINESNSDDLHSLNSTELSQVRRLASALNSLMDHMNLKEDVYYVGSYSSLVASILENSPVCVRRRKDCQNASALILVDRTLDLCGVTTHTTDSMLDKVMSVLPRFPGHSTDVAVNMSSICVANVVSVVDDVQLSPGCLFNGTENSGTIINNMICKPQREFLSYLYKELSKMNVQKSPTPMVKVTPQRLEKLVVTAKGKNDIIEEFYDVLQPALAVAQTLKSPQYAEIELISNLEKQVLQNIVTCRESTSVLRQVTKLIKKREERNLSMDRLLALLVYIYSLVGTEIAFLEEHHKALHEAISVALFEDNKAMYRGNNLIGQIVTPEECDFTSHKILKRLIDITQLRKVLNVYNSVMKPSETGTGYEYRGVLQQLIDDLLKPIDPNLGDLRTRRAGLKQFLRSGLSAFTKSFTGINDPLKSCVIVIFVIGGITAEEIKRMNQSIAASGVGTRFFIGSTKIVNPVEAMKNALLF